VSTAGTARRLLARIGAWWQTQGETVPAELAACEYDCRETECNEERFETCGRRQRTAARIRAEAASERPEATIPVPPDAVPSEPATSQPTPSTANT
jgi:hypothetical protein